MLGLWLLLSVVHAFTTNTIWISNAVFKTPVTVATMDIACAFEGGGRAVVCSPSQNITSMFPESAQVISRANETVAPSLSVSQTLFGDGLDVSILGYHGEFVNGTSSMTSGCSLAGLYQPTLSCSNWTDNRTTANRGVGSPYTTGRNSGWLHFSTDSCQTQFRVYCLASLAATPPTARIPTNVGIAPSFGLTNAPTRQPSVTSAPTSSGQASITPAPTKTAVLVPSRFPTEPDILVTSPTPYEGSAQPSLSPKQPPFTLSPSSSPASPTPKPTFRPTLAPTCGTCSQTLNVTGESQNVSVGVPGKTVLVLVPSSLFNNSNSSNNVSASTTTIAIVITSTTSKPYSSSQVYGSDSVISIDIKDDGVVRAHPTFLEAPIQFLMPASEVPSQCAVTPRCVWWDGAGWVSSGCTATKAQGGTLCSCTHLTDFAVLLDQAVQGCHTAQSITVYYPFVVLFGLLVVYCTWAVFLLLKERTDKENHSMLLLQHVLIGGVGVLRILSGLSFLGVFEHNVVASAFFTAAPYPLEYWLFTRLASTWAGLAHFSLLTTSARWAKIRPLFWTLNVLGSGLAIAMFVLFAMDASFQAAVVGTAVLSALYLVLAIAFNVYASKLLKELDGTSSSASVTKNSNKKASCCGVSGKIRWTGRTATFSFVIQAFSAVMAVVSEADTLMFWTALFLSFNFIALSCLLVVYYAALARALWSRTNSAGSHPQFLKSSSMKSGSMDLRNLATRESEVTNTSEDGSQNSSHSQPRYS